MLIYDRTIPTTSHNEEKQIQNLSNHIHFRCIGSY